MDYPKSVPSSGLVNGRFIDENPVAGTPGSLIPASWGNAITDEILNVLSAAGIAPLEGSNNQLITALRSGALFQTKPQFDNGKSAATTEFVQRALGSLRDVAVYNAATTLTAADIGRCVRFGYGGYSITLPAAGPAIANGSALYLMNTGTGAMTVVVNGGDKIAVGNGYLGSFEFGVGDSVVLVKHLNGEWTALLGSVPMRYMPGFACSMGGTGYQKLPSGLIVQWIAGGSDSNGNMIVSLPIQFPNAVLGGIANELNPLGWGATGRTTVWAFDLPSSNKAVVVAKARDIIGNNVPVPNPIGGRILVWGY
ncbi:MULTISPECIES: gp53-like domain-containing protein [Pseudomonas]|uniref:gp53-like domain-containing protein n=1 Tax=Pseudomonas TaxID=286 RepID=UPI000CD10529|nr:MULTISPECIES: phage tail protein [unclassified Pseudomonas]POA58729.1 phage tail protein [Pseudomonas sp. FW507-12TSA]